MKYNAPYGASDQDAPFVNGNPATGAAGSVPPAQSIEHPQREIVNAIIAAGLTPDANDLTQLSKAISILVGTGRPFATIAEAIAATIDNKVISPKTLAPAVQSGTWNYAVAAGSANAITVVLNPPVTAYNAGLVIRVILAAYNTGPVTINVNGLGARSVVHKDGTALQPNELNPGQLATMTYDGTAFQVEISYGRLLAIKTITASGVYTPTPGMAFVVVEGQGAGASGAGASQPSAGNVSLGSPGTCGAYGRGIFTAQQIGASVPITMGSPGVGTNASQGVSGGITSFGALMTLPGGLGGGMLNNQVAPTVNGTGSLTAAPTGANIFSFKGGAGTPTVAVSTSSGYAGAGGDSHFGKGGASTGINSNGVPASGYGSGGSGCVINQGGGTASGGSGAPPILIVEEYSL